MKIDWWSIVNLKWGRVNRVTVLLVLLCFSILVHLRLITFSNPFVATCVSALALFGLPGFVITNTLLYDNGWTWVERAVFSFGTGMALLTLPASLLVGFKGRLETLNSISLLLNIGLVVLYLLGELKGGSKPARASTAASFYQLERFNFEEGLLLTCYGVCIVALVFIYWRSSTPWALIGDRWNYMPYIRAYMDLPLLDPIGVLRPVESNRMNCIGWPAVLALLTKNSGVHLIDVYTTYFPPLLWLTSLISFHLAHKKLFQNRKQALFVSIIYVLYLLATLGRDIGVIVDRGGHRLFFGVIEDKCITLFVFFPLSLTLITAYIARPGWRYLLLLSVFAAAQASTHPVSYFLFGMVIGFFGLVRILTQCWPFTSAQGIISRLSHGDIIKFATVLAVISIFVVFSLWQRKEYLSSGEMGPAAQSYNPQLSPLGLETMRKTFLDRHMVLLDGNRYVAAPTLVQNQVQLWAIVLIPVLLLFTRYDIAAQYLLGAFVGPLVLLYIPSTATLLGRLIPAGVLYRINWIIPISQVVGYAFYQLLSLIRSKLWASKNKALQRYIPSFMPLVIVAVCAFAWRGEIHRGISYFQEQKERWMLSPAEERDLRDISTFLARQLVSKVTVLSDYRTLRYLTTFSAKTTNLIFAQLGDEREQVIKQISRLQKLEFFDTDAIAFMRQYDVKYIIWRRDFPSTCQFVLLTSFFRPIYQNETYILFEVISDLVPSHVIVGNSLLKQERYNDALLEYNLAVRLHPSEPAGYFGLGYVYYALGEWDKAISSYSKAVELSPDPSNTLQHIQLGIDLGYLGRYLAKRSNYQTPYGAHNNFVVVYDFLERLGIYPRQSSGVYRGAFVVGGIPRGVFFQHPVSLISYQLVVPTSAELEFHLALAPAVWQPGKGDGVQFDIYIDDGHARRNVFSRYIDPKNIPADRRWHDYKVDLSAWAGQTVTITFATGCGPNDNCDYDWAGWGEPRIVQPIAYNFLDHFSTAEQVTQGLGEVRVVTQTIDYEPRLLLFQHPSSQVAYSLTLPPQSTLYFGYGMAPEVWSPGKGDGVEYNIYVQRPEEPYKLYRVFHRIIDPKNNPDDRRWFDERVDLSRFGGQTVKIIFEALPGPAGNANYDWGGWSAPVLVDETLPGENIAGPTAPSRNVP